MRPRLSAFSEPSLFSFSSFLYFLSFLSLIRADSLYDKSDPILELDVDNFASSVYGQKRAFFVEFYSSWCGACIAYAPSFKKFAKQVESWSPVVQVSVVNCAEDKNMPLCREHAISAFPTIKYFKYESKAAADAELFKGNKHDLDTLPLELAALVHSDWELQRPQSWPSLESISTSTTVADIWSTTDKASLALLLVQESPATLAWATSLNFAGSSEVISSIVSPSHPEALQHIGSTGHDRKLLIFDRSSKRPIFISNEKVTLTEVQDKVKELLSDMGGAGKGAGAGEAPPPLQNAPALDDAARAAALADFSQYEVQLVDLESALSYLLTREVARHENIVGDDFNALKRWIFVLKQYAPGTTPTRRLLYRLNEWLETRSSVTGKEWLAQYDAIQTELGHPLPVDMNWLACRGSRSNLRGYTCGLWTLAHAITVEAYKAEKNKLSFDGAMSVLIPFRDFITRFLSCGECAANFKTESEKYNIGGAKSTSDMVLWLWNVHNSVNRRLTGAPAEDPQHPKRVFPPKGICSSCFMGDGSFNQDNVLHFLLTFYGNYKTDPVKPAPSYKTKEFRGGKLKAASNRHLNPKFGNVGAEKVDKLEEAEGRLKQELDASPQRHSKDIAGFRRDVLDGSAARKSSGAPAWMLWILSALAVVLLLVYCKYRRNRSKFWKTFYYNNDFKLPWHVVDNGSRKRAA